MIGPLARLIHKLRRNRRGAVMATFGLTAVTLLGLAGLATEAGSWYFAHRRAQNAADAAAMAGAISLAGDISGAATTCANATAKARAQNATTNVASLNGYTSGGPITVTANCPPVGSPGYSGDNNAVQAVIDQVQTISFARLFGINAKTVTTGAVAKVLFSGDACVLSLTDKLWITGNFTANSPNCMFASNKKGSNSIDIGGSSIVNVQSLHASGQCQGCYSNNVTPGTPVVAYGPDTTNPFAALDNASWPNFNGSSCAVTSNYNSFKSGNVYTLPPWQTNGNKGYCKTFQLTHGETLNLSPGTYFFDGASFKIIGGTVQCSTCSASQGVSIVLLAQNNSQVGDIDIRAQASVNLTAGTITGTYSNLSGVLFYRRVTANQTGGPLEVNINGGAGTRLEGGFYFPLADAQYAGNSSSQCTVIVGGSIKMIGDATFDTTTCTSLGTSVPQVRRIALVE